MAVPMGLYSRTILPRLVHHACSIRTHERQRLKVVPRATGNVLEIGVGSGLNLPHYDRNRVEQVTGIDPSAEMLAMAETAVGSAPCPVSLVLTSAEDLPFERGTFDTVLITYTLCTIPDGVRALREIGRVLAPGGSLIFCEHGRAPDEKVRRWQNRTNPIWRRFSGGCHLNRDIPSLLAEGGFRVRDIDTMYLPGWKPATFNYWGTAVLR